MHSIISFVWAVVRPTLGFSDSSELPDHPNLHGVGVGFDLKYSYGTAAVSYPNGSIFNVARVETTKEYRDAIFSLSLPSSRHFAPPYSNAWERFSDLPRQTQRKSRKARGLPASDDVGAISTIITALKTEVENSLGFQIHSASASVPRLPAIYDEDLYDSFEYAGLDYLQIITSTSSDGRLFTSGSSAALAGHALSLCPNITNPETCREDGSLDGTYYIVDYSKSSLFVYSTVAMYDGAYNVMEILKFDLQLGSDGLHHNPDPEYYWEAVREVLLQPLLQWYWDPPKTIVIVGESAYRPDFRLFLNETLREFYTEGLPPIYDQDALYVQAHGIAEFMRRWPYRPKPWKPDSGPLRYSQSPLTDQRQSA